MKSNICKKVTSKSRIWKKIQLFPKGSILKEKLLQALNFSEPFKWPITLCAVPSVVLLCLTHPNLAYTPYSKLM